MEIIRTNRLNSQQKKEALALVERCRNECRTRLSLPAKVDGTFYLLYDPHLVCVLLLERPEADETDGDEGDAPLECRAFTLPDCQRQGYFSKLLDAACEDAGERELLFIMDHSNAGAVFALTALEAELLEDHYKMELTLDRLPAASAPGSRLSMSEEAVDHTLTFTFYEGEGTPVGTARAACYETSVCLHDFEMAPAVRGRGLGREALCLFISRIRDAGFDTLFLHVSGSNQTAVNLYQKTGFRITETLSFYLY